MSNNYMDTYFQWYSRGISTVKPDGNITLRQLINSIISPKKEMLESFELIKQAGLSGNKAEKDRLKAERLFFTTPSAIFNPIRNYASITNFTNFGIFEYDDIEHCEVLRDYIFEKRKDCIFAFCSPSFTGCKFVFLFGETPTSIIHYKQLWFGVACELDKFKNLDLSNARCTQPLYNSYDPNAKFRENAVGVVVKGYKINSFVPFVGEIETPENVSDEDKEKCFNLVANLINRIIDSAHNQVLSTSFLSGGLSAFYGINQDEMFNFLEDKIRSNNYMKKGTEGYLTTAKTMYFKGLINPVELSKEKDKKL